MMQKNSCPNFNHKRSDAPVRFCPNCGEVVNNNVPISKCSDERHAKMRMNRAMYCVDCGEQLIAKMR